MPDPAPEPFAQHYRKSSISLIKRGKKNSLALCHLDFLGKLVNKEKKCQWFRISKGKQKSDIHRITIFLWNLKHYRAVLFHWIEPLNNQDHTKEQKAKNTSKPIFPIPSHKWSLLEKKKQQYDTHKYWCAPSVSFIETLSMRKKCPAAILTRWTN